MESAQGHVSTQATIPETARNRKKREAVGGFENEGEDGGMKRKSDETTYACPQEVRAVMPQSCPNKRVVARDMITYLIPPFVLSYP